VTVLLALTKRIVQRSISMAFGASKR
jgi:hypothetical protein